MRADLVTPAKILQRSTKKLQERWQQTAEQWDDRVSAQFRDKYLEPVVPQVKLVLQSLHELMGVLDEAAAETHDERTLAE